MRMAALSLVREARRQAGLTQAELAARMGTSQSVVARLESSTANPRLRTLERALSAAGRRLEAAPVQATVDEGQLRERLAMTPAERLATFTESHRNLQRLRRRARRAA